jgi:MFS superfamily sulfate permease-like transporter
MEIGFAPEMIAPTAIMPHIFLRVIAPRNDGSGEEAGMTAYLISLALAGLVVIVLWEGLS